MIFNNNHIYASLNDPAIDENFASVEQQCAELAEKSRAIDSSKPADISRLLAAFDELFVTLYDINTFASLIQVVDSSNEAAEELDAKCATRIADLEQQRVPLIDALVTLEDAAFKALIDQADIKPFRFLLAHERAMAIHRLSIDEETLLKKMAVDGLQAWEDQYFKLSAGIKCDIDGQKIGLAAAFNMTMSEDRTIRDKAWHAMQAGWTAHEDSVVAGLNAINGWRLNELERRSGKQPMHYLDVACHQAHITRDTLTALMETAHANRATGHRAIRAMNKWNGIENAKPWDLLAPPVQKGGPPAPGISLDDCMKIISGAFAEFDQEMADFAMMMADKGWIDTTPTPNRATGAFCTEFYAAGEPRVFMTYEGTMGNVLTLAHEIGHAWHAWLLRDLGFSEKHYPMTLAETASIFAETLVRQALLTQATNDDMKREILWQEAESASAFLVNIPARFDFEKTFVEARMETKVSANSARSMMGAAWEKWYGDSISQYDELFWASKLHFSIAEIGFYNYPYLFGYLFALGVYAQKDIQGDNFRFAYRDLLQDTGRMTAEACIRKHLGRNIEETSFWQDSIDVVEGTIQEFERLV